MVTDSGGTWVGRYTEEKYNITNLYKQYQNENIRAFLFGVDSGISKFTGEFESWFTNYRLAATNAKLTHRCPPADTTRRRSSRGALDPIDDCLKQQLSKYNIMQAGLYNTAGVSAPSCFNWLLQCLQRMINPIQQNQVNFSTQQQQQSRDYNNVEMGGTGGGGRSEELKAVMVGGGNFPCLETGMAGRTRSLVSQKPQCSQDVFIEVLNIVEKLQPNAMSLLVRRLILIM